MSLLLYSCPFKLQEITSLGILEDIFLLYYFHFIILLCEREKSVSVNECLL